MKPVSAILLGAGESRRMGANKLALPWGRETVFERVLETILRSGIAEVIVVVSPRTRRLMGQMRQARVRVVTNRDFRKGMGASIQKGVKALDPRSRGILIALGDQPLLHPRTVDALMAAYSQNKGLIVVPVYQGRRGHPVLFDRRFENELRSLSDDAGGRSILANHAEEVFELRTRSAGVVKDLDTPGQYRNALRTRRGRPHP